MYVLFHLGIHKTASTLLQQEVFPKIPNCLFLTREWSSELKRYILYTDDFDFCPNEAFNIFMKILKHNKTKSYNTIIISDEEYYGNPYWGAIDRKRNISRIIETFGENVRFLILIRNQYDLLNSLYNQYIKTGGTATFKQFTSHRKFPLIIQSGYFKYDKYLEYIINKTSRNRLKILLFEEFIKNKKLMIQNIILYLNSNSVIEIKLNKVVNSSLHNRVIPIMRFFNKITKSPKEPFLFLNFLAHNLIRRLLLNVNMKLLKNRKYIIDDRNFLDEINKSNNNLKQLFDDLNIEKYNYPI